MLFMELTSHTLVILYKGNICIRVRHERNHDHDHDHTQIMHGLLANPQRICAVVPRLLISRITKYYLVSSMFNPTTAGVQGSTSVSKDQECVRSNECLKPDSNSGSKQHTYPT